MLLYNRAKCEKALFVCIILCKPEIDYDFVTIFHQKTTQKRTLRKQVLDKQSQMCYNYVVGCNRFVTYLVQ